MAISRRDFLIQAAGLPLALKGPVSSSDRATLFLCGDVMTGRGIDQILPRPGDPRLYEPYMRSAEGYVRLAEQVSGRLARPVSLDYVWGDLLPELERVAPAARIINLETSVTMAGHPWPGKGIHYRMHPGNTGCLTAAGIQACVLSNNHVLDWGRAGLAETLTTLRTAGVQTPGAGRDAAEARSPAILAAGGGRVLVFGFGAANSGVPEEWEARGTQPGVSFLPDLSTRTLRRVAEQLRGVKRPGDVVIASIHWGGNWGYEIPEEQQAFARGLIDQAAVDVVHGHSSHHVKGIEVYRGRLILYGCGDFLNDYEGISGHEEFRGDLVLAYFPTFDLADGRLVSLEMTPFRIRRFRLNRASGTETDWLRGTLDRECRRFGGTVESATNSLVLRTA